MSHRLVGNETGPIYLATSTFPLHGPRSCFLFVYHHGRCDQMWPAGNWFASVDFVTPSTWHTACGTSPHCQAAQPVLRSPSEVWNWKGVGLWGRKGGGGGGIRADKAGLPGTSKPRPAHSCPGQSGPQPLAMSDLWRRLSIYHGLGVRCPYCVGGLVPRWW